MGRTQAGSEPKGSGGMPGWEDWQLLSQDHGDRSVQVDWRWLSEGSNSQECKISGPLPALGKPEEGREGGRMRMEELVKKERSERRAKQRKNP